MRSQRERKNRALPVRSGVSGLVAPKGQQLKARGGTPGAMPHDTLCALKGHTEQGACGHRSPCWGEVSWGGVTQGSAPLHLGLSPCALTRREWTTPGEGTRPTEASSRPPVSHWICRGGHRDHGVEGDREAVGKSGKSRGEEIPKFSPSGGLRRRVPKVGSRGRARTYNHTVNSRVLYH